MEYTFILYNIYKNDILYDYKRMDCFEKLNIVVYIQDIRINFDRCLK